MKFRKIFLVLTFLFLSQNMAALALTQYVGGNLSVTSDSEFSYREVTMPLFYIADMDDLYFTVTGDFFTRKPGFSIDAVYAPFLFYRFQAGAEVINHFLWYEKDFFEFDFLAGLYLNYTPFYFLEIHLNFLYHLKHSLVYSLGGKSVVDNNPAFSTTFRFYILDWLDAELTLSSYTATKYYLFLSPINRLAFNFTVHPDVEIGLAFEAQFVDFYTLSANLNRLSSFLSVTWRIDN